MVKVMDIEVSGMKKIICKMLILLSSLLVAIPLAEAQDVWVYSAQDGTNYYVMDETVAVRGKGNMDKYRAMLKTVRNNTCINKTTWSFSFDEGYVMATNVEKDETIVIHRGTSFAGNELVHNRPELMALLDWLYKNFK